MYLLHQVPADGMKAGDTITLELNVESGEEHAMVQFPAIVIGMRWWCIYCGNRKTVWAFVWYSAYYGADGDSQ